jgi:hypothetical protein
VRWAAAIIKDDALNAKLSAGDLPSLDAMYHARCLASLYNRARDTKPPKEHSTDDINHGLALAGLISYIEEVRADIHVAPVFKLSNLVQL